MLEDQPEDIQILPDVERRLAYLSWELIHLEEGPKKSTVVIRMGDELFKISRYREPGYWLSRCTSTMFMSSAPAPRWFRAVFNQVVMW